MCHLKMKAQPINIIGEHLLLVTTWGEQERAAIHQPHWRVSVWGGVGGESSGTELAHPSLNPGRPGYRVHVWSRHLPVPDHSRVDQRERKRSSGHEKCIRESALAL